MTSEDEDINERIAELDAEMWEMVRMDLIHGEEFADVRKRLRALKEERMDRAFGIAKPTAKEKS